MSAVRVPMQSGFKACPADGVRAEFGVCRGNPIRYVQDLILGDTFLPKRDATWLTVEPESENNSAFVIDRAANLPQQSLVTLAELIFMSTTGQRVDVFAAVYDGQLFFVSETPFRTNFEYVLVDINSREDAVIPAITPTDLHDLFPAPADEPANASVATLRRFG